MVFFFLEYVSNFLPFSVNLWSSLNLVFVSGNLDRDSPIWHKIHLDVIYSRHFKTRSIYGVEVFSLLMLSAARCICLYLPNPSARTGCDTRSIFKQCFPFARTSCHTKAKATVSPTIYQSLSRLNRWIYTFPKIITIKGNKYIFTQTNKVIF